MARYVDDGVQVTLVTCTLGEEGEILVDDGLITIEQLDEARRESEQSGKSLGRTLIDMGLVGEAALVKAGSTLYRVRKGNYMGQNHGKVTNLSETEIRISEIVSDGKGSFVSRDTSLALGQ